MNLCITTALFIGGIGLIVIGVLLHVWADDPLSMTWWVMAGAVLGMSQMDSRSKVRE